MESEKRDVSFWVFVGFLLLFLVFMFLGPNEKSGNAIIGSSALGESPSIVIVIVLFIVLIVVLAVVFIIFKKIKKKKMKGGVLKPEDRRETPKGRGETNLEMGEEEVEKLFSEGEMEKPKEEPLEKLEQKPKKVLTNLQELKDRVKGMLGQKFTKDQITTDLKSEGISVDQINRVIGEVNIENLKVYVNKALKQGFTKDQIIRNLAMHGWKKEQISKVIH